MATNETKGGQIFTAKKIAVTAMFAALSAILYYLGIKLPFFPSFLELHFSDLPALICGFAIGPWGGAIVEIVKVLIKLPGTHSSGVGELADLLVGLAYVVPAAIIYKKNKNKKYAIIGLIVGSVASVIMACFINRFILINFYSQIMGFETIVKVCSVVIPAINAENFYFYYIFAAVIPFNCMRVVIISLVTYFVYKHVSNAIKRL